VNCKNVLLIERAGGKSCFLTFQRLWSVLTVTREADYKARLSHEFSAARSEVAPRRVSKYDGRPQSALQCELPDGHRQEGGISNGRSRVVS